MNLNSVAVRAGRRLLASDRKYDPEKALFSTIAHHLKQHGIKSFPTDDEGTSLIAQGSTAQVLMGLSSLGWSHGPEEPVLGGLYCSGTAVTVDGTTPLRLIQTAIDRVYICKAEIRNDQE